jgi:rod shape-determining protein MreC
MNFFTPSSSPTLRLAVCAVLSLALMVSDHQRQHAVWVRSALSVVVYPLRLAVNTLFVDLPRDAVAWLSARRTLIRESEGLRHQLLVLGSRIERLQELEGENRRLRELLESSARIEDRVLVASVLGVDIDPASSGLVLDKGTQHGIRPGQSVIDANGILGQVDHAGPISSTVVLITDSSHALPVMLSRNGLRSVAVGGGPTGELDLAYVPKDADIEVGDLLVSSGLGGRFPAGYPAATVVKVETARGGSYAEVRLRPLANLKRAREVLVVFPSDGATEGTDAG